MQIEGTIHDVFETWPLQLAVKTAQGDYHIALSLDTAVVKGGQPAEARALRARQRVRIDGEESGPGALQARRIEILA